MRVWSVVAAAAVLLGIGGAASGPNRELIVCGWDEVYILDLNQQPPTKVWSWRGTDSPEIPEGMREQFRTTDECKPVNGGKLILITSSSDGIALVDRATRKALFRGSAGGAHSAEMLPRGRIAVAASTSKNPLNNRLVLFDVKRPGHALFHTELVSGHGVIWDAKRERLWALSGSHLRTYRLEKWETETPELIKDAEFSLPDRGGHDLMPEPGTNLLWVTTEKAAWVFDRGKRTFAPHPLLGAEHDVKSATVHPETRQVVWTQADKGFWWTEKLRFLRPEGTVVRSGERMYKARWVAASR